MRHENIVRLEGICASSRGAAVRPDDQAAAREGQPRDGSDGGDYGSDGDDGDDGIFLVFEYLPFDLAGLLQPTINFRPTPGQVRGILFQILEALAYMHEHHIVHRDVKASNILLSRGGALKFADFGLAKVALDPDAPADEEATTRLMTNRVVTLWYRAPELLLGSTTYGAEVDMWSVGCIMVEIVSGRAAFTANDEIGQLEAICRRLRLGSASDLAQAGLGGLPWFVPVTALVDSTSAAGGEGSCGGSGGPFDEYLGVIGADGVDLMGRLLSLSPGRRPSARGAQRHPFFASHARAPADLSASLSAIPEDWHEFECKQRRKGLSQ